jgi:phage terminase small subunit
MVGRKTQELTPRQDKLAREYAKTGNKTLSGKRAGYAPKSAHSTAHDTLKIPKVAHAVAVYRKRTAERLDISREKLLNDAAHDAEQAAIEGDWSGANSNRTFIAKVLGYQTNVNVNVSVDASAAHLAALQQLLDRRAPASPALQPGDDAVRITHIMENGTDD